MEKLSMEPLPHTDTQTGLSEDEKIDRTALEILERFRAAFEELAK